MARKPRLKSESGINHIMLRGINKQDIFLDDEDYRRFLKTMLDAKKKSNFEIYAFCLMSNHIHLLLNEKDNDISTIVKQIACSYVYWYNKKYERVGHLFQDRFRSEPVDNDEYLLTVLKYIHHNPLKANLVKKCDDYTYSSYKLYFTDSALIDKQFILSIININQYKVFHSDVTDDMCLDIPDYTVKMNDAKAKNAFIDLMIAYNSDNFLGLEPNRQKELLKKAKNMGMSIPQLVDITGLKKWKIDSMIYASEK